MISWMGAVQAYRAMLLMRESRGIFFYQMEKTCHVEESCTKVNPGNINGHWGCGDVVDEYAICQRRACAGREFEVTIVNDGYETSSQENNGQSCAVQKVMRADGCNNLQDNEAECINDA